MCDPISLGTIFASIGSAFRFADLAIRIAEVGTENEVFVRTIQIVRDDLNEVERLLNADSVQQNLANVPSKLPWIRNATVNTKSALDDIAKWVERARSEQEATGGIHFNTRVKWVINDHEKLMNRTTELTACHQQLLNVSSYLVHLEDVPVSKTLDYSDTAFFDDVLSRHRRKTTWTSSVTSQEDTKATACKSKPTPMQVGADIQASFVKATSNACRTSSGRFLRFATVCTWF
jgi:hypothetical protein